VQIAVQIAVQSAAQKISLANLNSIDFNDAGKD
jgi:hypothetical protein